MVQPPDVATLRQAFVAFASPTEFPDPTVQFWLDFAARLVGVERWGETAPLGIMLLACHHLTLASKAAKAGSSGGAVGVLSSKSIDGVSLSYDVSRATTEGAGHFNLTTYGIQFLQLSKLHGAGPVHVGEDAFRNHSSAWSGFVYPNF